MDSLRRRMRDLTTKRVQPSQSPLRMQEVPHKILPGQEDLVCPITGLSLHDVEQSRAAKQGREALETDPDIIEERRTLMRAEPHENPAGDGRLVPKVREYVPLNVIGRTHHASPQTVQLIRSVGGLRKLRRFTSIFYELAFQDPHIDRFLRDHSDPHGERFASWIAEKFGDGTPWSDERRTRAPTVLRIGHERVHVAFDRSSAHVAAWNSPKREAHKRGDHFKLDDARVWMRLHFWAARQAGLFEHHEEFMDYYTRFIGHFVRVYSSNSPMFTRESARWSANPANIQRYLDSGNTMVDVIGVPLETAVHEISFEERGGDWPYGSAQGK